MSSPARAQWSQHPPKLALLYLYKAIAHATNVGSELEECLLSLTHPSKLSKTQKAEKKKMVQMIRNHSSPPLTHPHTHSLHKVVPPIQACSAKGLVGSGWHCRTTHLHGHGCTEHLLSFLKASTGHNSGTKTFEICSEVGNVRSWGIGPAFFFLLVFSRHFSIRLPERRKSSHIFQMRSAYYRWVFCYYTPPLISKSRWKWKTVSYSKNHIIIIINLNSYCEYLQPQWSDLSSMHLRVLIVCTWMYLHILSTLHHFHSW